VRIALVSPYSYTYPGGVGRHVEALGHELLREGHDVRLLAPYDPDDRLARVSHRGARPDARPAPDHLISLGRTVGLPMNGAVSNLSVAPFAVATLGRELRHGGYDVVHVHEPNAPVVSWYAVEAARPPVVGTFHCYSTSRFSNNAAALVGARRLYNKLHMRVAVSEAARWTAQRFYGGRYRIVPNGVDLAAARPNGGVRSDAPLQLLFLGRAEERKGLPVLLRAYEGLRAVGVEVRLTVAGATRDEVQPFLLDDEGIEITGRVTDDEKWSLLADADLLCAPSLGGESFGMVLTEAFASGTPVVCSDIAGYRDVVRDGRDGVLVPPGDATALGKALHGLAGDPDRRAAMSGHARVRAERFSWPRVTGELVSLYEEAAALPEPSSVAQRVAVRTGLRNADMGPRVPARRLPSLEAVEPGAGRRRAFRAVRRAAVVGCAALGVGLTALALDHIGLKPIGNALLAATPVWVLVAFALMCTSMLIRAEAWHAVLRAALPNARVRRRDAARGTMIGVLMSATLPARLGEPSRALIVARRMGRVRERLPVVLGTLVAQTFLNVVALIVLGIVMFSTIGLFQGNEDKLVAASLAPVILIAVLLAAPALLRRGRPSRFVRLRNAIAVARGALVEVRSGLRVFRNPRLGTWAATTQLAAWGVQWIACYVLLVALGLDEHAGIGAAAAVLFAVNVTAVLPATPSNLGVFQAACVAVLSAYGVGHSDAFAYGIILQAVEMGTAFAMGMPALVREGMTWKDMRLRALHAAPVDLRAAIEAKT
jgi:phosphatidyl-myo-inositol alpha-mannosyltransferase